ncbi:MAG: hypothetical protein QF655_03705 [Candidatus Woesearchaeota archaeon]|jgi:hypothetical protein|nr:hypothetical protein [Candidatus Woesearchaeota archaeon]MDP7322849.1 hypothetical protein [Candidatus Woesearchaeota archaeon]MDP7476706.1 hypothetical protein [Candidatus Woesearchaeota archaeon]HJO01515.1 hypothetical protein [Candidatus Woesearchaeota archaeon]
MYLTNNCKDFKNKRFEEAKNILLNLSNIFVRFTKDSVIKNKNK